MNEIVPNPQVREGILAVQTRMEQAIAWGEWPREEGTLIHHFTPGLYARELRIPGGVLTATKIHKYAHVVVLSKGKVSVMSEEGVATFEAPHTFITKAGTKRLVYHHTDVVWTTIHKLPDPDRTYTENDLDEIESYLISPSFEALEQKEGLICLG